MEQIQIENLHFTYPLCENEALCGVDLTVHAGEYIALCGESGCGKTTLLRHLKNALTPAGKRVGAVCFCGTPIAELDARTEAEKIGFVQQDPENAVVTDKVYHELAFGLESLGVSQSEMRLRVAEMASYFGIESWFDRSTDSLSGGQLQLLNLASVMALHPDVLLLDEPTSQLDPVAASDFLTTIDRIHRELGLTVILTEHRLEDVLPCADRVVVLHRGRVAADCKPREIGAALSGELGFLRGSMPSSMRIWAGVDSDLPCPLTVCEGKRWLSDTVHVTQPVRRDLPEEKAAGVPAVRMREVFFTYDKQSPDVLRGLTMDVPQGGVFALLGGNGAGKSTALKTAAGLLKPYRGKVELLGRDVRKIPPKELYRAFAAVLPQQVRTLFTEKTVRLELESIDREQADRIAERLHLTGFLDKHPYDVSGGEQQRVALGKVLLTKPRLLFLDEPTKGMDSAFKESFADLLREMCAGGATVFMVSHDVEFCAKTADRCAMLFDGVLAADAPTVSFFSNNTFYTTAANRIARHVFPDAITDEDVIALCRENRI